ncbi:MAG TPA: tetraacyldisaccharide 4'-kinase [Burkholderiaceae bacterium]|jgi:tetraacyldisaccharide 4'-kinase|nr:tetraacyldisaccharide 4'-kinase [Burkholderiaceae bacterium]
MSPALRRGLESLLQRLWYAGDPGLALRALRAGLAPLSALTAAVASGRRARLRALPAPRPPVVVVGNLVAGGAGKTPLVAAIATALLGKGLRPGIVASGYGAVRSDARLVRAGDDPAQAGDEPLLLAQTTGVPVAAARRRAEAVALLGSAHPELDLVISDDGLQHAGLARSVELVVFDERGAGNGRLLPAGPLRAPLAQLASMDALVLNGDAAAPIPHPRQYRFRVEPVRFVAVDASAAPVAAVDFAQRVGGRSLVAVAGTAAPQRFFDALRGLGLRPRCIALGDHATLRPAALAALPEAFVVMTGKDAVKCAAWADDRCWALEVRAVPEPDFIDWLTETIRGRTLA